MRNIAFELLNPETDKRFIIYDNGEIEGRENFEYLIEGKPCVIINHIPKLIAKVRAGKL